MRYNQSEIRERLGLVCNFLPDTEAMNRNRAAEEARKRARQAESIVAAKRVLDFEKLTVELRKKQTKVRNLQLEIITLKNQISKLKSSDC